MSDLCCVLDENNKIKKIKKINQSQNKKINNSINEGSLFSNIGNKIINEKKSLKRENTEIMILNNDNNNENILPQINNITNINIHIYQNGNKGCSKSNQKNENIINYYIITEIEIEKNYENIFKIDETNGFHIDIKKLEKNGKLEEKEKNLIKFKNYLLQLFFINFFNSCIFCLL